MSFYHDHVRNLSIYQTQSDVLRKAIPEAKPFNGHYLAVPHNLRNAQVLRYFGYPVAPIITDQNYDWPIEPGRKALPHQKIMANFAVVHPRSFNLSDPGTMKTLATLWAADWLMQQHPPGTFRVLVIAPLTILDTVWATGIFKNFLSRRSFEILHGSADKRRQLLARKPDFAIINPDGVGVGAHTRKRFELDGFAKELADDKAIRMVVIDEADTYCDSQTKRHRLARAIFGDRPYILPLTGTPTSQAPTDAYGIAKLVNNAFGKSFTGFRLDTMHKLTLYKWVPRKDGYDKARQLLSPAIRFDIKEVWQDAPELTTQQREVPLTDEQKKLLVDLKRDLSVMVKGQQVDAINEAAARQKFIQIVLGAVYDRNHRAHVVDATPRFEEIERIIGMTPRKVLVFVPLTSIVNLLHKRLSKRWKCRIINGDVPQKERARLIREFETDPDFKVMIMDPQPTAHGINEFVVADTVIWAGPTEKTRLYIQANKRAHRPGQKWPVTVYQLVSTALEKEIFRRLETNTSLQGALLDAIRLGTL